jgi:DNA mismatch endonuclease (patch repair protein)
MRILCSAPCRDEITSYLLRWLIYCAGDEMVDVLTAQQRQFNMSRIRGGDTKPEMTIRRGLHSLGLRYRLHARTLPGRPDLVFPRYRAVILVHGCFWHGHHCHLFRMPATRPEFWQNKIDANRQRDSTTHIALRADGWRILTVWECSLKGSEKWPLQLLLDTAAAFVRGSEVEREIEGPYVPPIESQLHAPVALMKGP